MKFSRIKKKKGGSENDSPARYRGSSQSQRIRELDIMRRKGEKKLLKFQIRKNTENYFFSDDLSTKQNARQVTAFREKLKLIGVACVTQNAINLKKRFDLKILSTWKCAEWIRCANNYSKIDQKHQNKI